MRRTLLSGTARRAPRMVWPTLCALLLLVLAAAAQRAAFAAEPPLDRPLRLNLWGSGLNEAAREIKAQTGVDVLFYRPDLPADRNTDTVYIVTGRVTLRTVLECLARRFSFRYRLSESGRIELSKGYNWAAGEPSLRILPLNGLTSAAHPDPEEARGLLLEFVKYLPLLPGDNSLTVEKYPMSGDPHAVRVTAVMPPVAADYLERAANCLRDASGDYPAPGGTEPYARATRIKTDWQGILLRTVSATAGGDARSVLASVAEQTETAIMVAAPAAGGAAANETALVAGGSLGQVSLTLATRYTLGKRVFLVSGGLIFEGGDGAAMETDDASRELFWSGLAVAGFDARAAAEKAGGGDALAAALKREAFPALWRDPACAMAYSPVSGRLAVIAPANVMPAVAEQLAAFASR